MIKFKTFGVLAGLSVFVTIFGFWAKLTHQAYADNTLKIGMWSLAICAGIYTYFMVINLRKK